MRRIGSQIREGMNASECFYNRSLYVFGLNLSTHRPTVINIIITNTLFHSDPSNPLQHLSHHQPQQLAGPARRHDLPAPQEAHIDRVDRSRCAREIVHGQSEADQRGAEPAGRSARHGQGSGARLVLQSTAEGEALESAGGWQFGWRSIDADVNGRRSGGRCSNAIGKRLDRLYAGMFVRVMQV